MSKGPRRQFNCSSSSSSLASYNYHDDESANDDSTAVTEYTSSTTDINPRTNITNNVNNVKNVNNNITSNRAVTNHTSHNSHNNHSNHNNHNSGGGENYDKASGLFQEAEEMIARGIENIFGGTISCGIPQFKKKSKKRNKRRNGDIIDDEYNDDDDEYDDDDDPDEGVKLDWRKDPYHSMSDWTLIIRDAGHGGKNKSGNATKRQQHQQHQQHQQQSRPQTYHIHKTIVSYGQRKSGFLIKLFEDHIMQSTNHHHHHHHRQDRNSSSSSSTTTELALPTTAANHIPTLLNYIYFDKLQLNAQNAPPLRHLANLFDVRELYALVSSFIQTDLTNNSNNHNNNNRNNTITTYIREADAVNDQELFQLCLNIAIQQFTSISDESLSILPPRLFQQLICHPQLLQLSTSSSIVLSKRIATYIRSRATTTTTTTHNHNHNNYYKEEEDGINDEIFYFMTHCQILPQIDPTEALWYLIYTHRKYPNVLIDDSMGGYEGTLKRRCIVASSSNWKMLLLGEIRDNVRRKLDGGTSGGIVVSGMSGDGGGSPTRRRLFVDGDDEIKLDQGRGYMSLPMDIRIELLEEALLNAATATSSGTGGGDTSNPKNNTNSNTRRGMRGRSSSAAGQSSFESSGREDGFGMVSSSKNNGSSSDYEQMLSATNQFHDNLKKERRGDKNGGKRVNRNSHRERRGMV